MTRALTKDELVRVQELQTRLDKPWTAEERAFLDEALSKAAWGRDVGAALKRESAASVMRQRRRRAQMDLARAIIKRLQDARLGASTVAYLKLAKIAAVLREEPRIPRPRCTDTTLTALCYVDLAESIRGALVRGGLGRAQVDEIPFGAMAMAIGEALGD